MKYTKSGFAAAALVTLAACGGSGGSTAPDPVVTPPPPPPPAGQTETYVTVKGEITGFGSVFVNGRRYNTDQAEVRVDGRTANLSDLSVGQIVAIRARRNGEGELPTALRVRYEEVLEGPVESVAADRRSLVILGQTVFLTDDTVFEDIEREDIEVDDVLEVSGSFTSDGDIVASYVEISDDVDSDYEVHGVVGALDTAAQTFRVRGLKIGYANAELVDFDDGETLSNGDRVEVEGSQFLNDGTLLATRVEFEGDDLDDLEGDEDDDDDENEVELEGFITEFDGPSSFVVGDTPVTTNADTEFEGCAPDELGLDVRVEVEGRLLEDGTVLADEVECEREADLRLRGEVDAVDPQLGTVSVLGVTYTVIDTTKYQDLGPNRVREFGLDDLAPGDVVELRGYGVLEADGTVSLVATRLQRGDRGKFDTDEVRGVVDTVDAAADTLVVSGVLVAFNEDTRFEVDDEEVSREDFLDELDDGDAVKVRGMEGEDNLLVADKIILDSEDD